MTWWTLLYSNADRISGWWHSVGMDQSHQPVYLHLRYHYKYWQGTLILLWKQTANLSKITAMQPTPTQSHHPETGLTLTMNCYKSPIPPAHYIYPPRVFSTECIVFLYIQIIIRILFIKIISSIRLIEHSASLLTVYPYKNKETLSNNNSNIRTASQIM